MSAVLHRRRNLDFDRFISNVTSNPRILRILSNSSSVTTFIVLPISIYRTPINAGAVSAMELPDISSMNPSDKIQIYRGFEYRPNEIVHFLLHQSYLFYLLLTTDSEMNRLKALMGTQFFSRTWLYENSTIDYLVREYCFFLQIIKYGLILLFNVTMWVCYVNSLRELSALQATVTNFAANFLSSGIAGYFFFEESLSLKVNISL